MKKRLLKAFCITTFICVASATTLTGCAFLKGAQGIQGTQGSQGIQGEAGVDGVGIEKIEKSATENNIDTYTIYLTDGTTATFSVTNGQNGVDGENGENGTDGVSITNATVNEDKELVLSFSDETTINLGKIVGDNGIDGIDGQNGISITGAELNEQGELILSFSTGAPLNLGNVKGADGKNGENGVGIEKVEMNEAGELMITLTDSTPIKLGKIVGENGKNGVSVSNVSLDNYELTITLSDGTVYELGNIRGEKGDQGIPGEKGENGVQGEQGIQGEMGKSAYELYQETYGYEGTEEEWLSDLVNGRLATLNSYMVTFNPNNGEEIFTQSVEDGKKLSAPTTPTKEGYDFLGWFAGDEKWSFVGYTVTEDIELVAKWEEKETPGLSFTALSDNTYSVAAGEALYNETIHIPSMHNGKPVTVIQEKGFYGAKNLKQISLPNSIHTLEYSAFSGCTSLENIELKEGLSVIDDSAFSGCSSLKEIVIPNTVTQIGRSTNLNVFSGCTSLERLTVPFVGWTSDNLHHIGVFFSDKYTSGTKDEKLLAVATGESYKQSSYPYNTYYYFHYVPKSLVEIVVTGGEIAANAFNACSSFLSVTLGKDVKTVGKSAFAGCNSLTIYCEESSVPADWEINWNPLNRPIVWDCCNNNVADDGCLYTKINGIRYALKDNQATVTAQPSNISSLHIPSNVTYNNQNYIVTNIGDRALYYCQSLTELILPKTITNIPTTAIYNAGTGINVYYEGNIEDWNNITSSAFTSATIYYYSETTPSTTGNYWHYDENGNIAIW